MQDVRPDPDVIRRLEASLGSLYGPTAAEKAALVDAIAGAKKQAQTQTAEPAGAGDVSDGMARLTIQSTVVRMDSSCFSSANFAVA
jgi:hypothetical protein